MHRYKLDYWKAGASAKFTKKVIKLQIKNWVKMTTMAIRGLNYLTHFGKNWWFLLSISWNSVTIRYLGFCVIQTMEIHEKPSKTCSNPFWGPENRYLDHLRYSIFILEKVQFLPYPAVLKSEYLELGIEFWHFVKSVEFVWESFSIRSQRFLRNVKTQFLAQDIRVWVRLGMAEIGLLQYKFIITKI